MKQYNVKNSESNHEMILILSKTPIFGEVKGLEATELTLGLITAINRTPKGPSNQNLRKFQRAK